ncbi:MAG TPA: HAD-IIIA family hydrolase [Clostridiales bacterium]|nr:HAD-IIIA family hydrolase [Clostridiales bacterium]
MKQLAIFDLDGTLLNTITDLAHAYNYALDAYGFPGYSVEEYQRLVGNGVVNLLTNCLPEGHRDEDTILRVQAVFQQYYNIHANDNTRPYPGIPEMLQTIRQKGMKVAVLSNKPHRFSTFMIQLQLPGLVDLVLGAREGIPLKPDPTAVYEVLQHFQLDKQDCVYIGDSETDIQTGRNAGVDTIGVSWGYRSKETLINSSALVIVDKIDELCKILVDN